VLRTTVRRHPTTTFAVFGGVVVLALVSVAMSVLYARAVEAERVAAGERDVAERERASAETALERARRESAQRAAMSEFLRGVLSATNPAAGGRDAKVADLLDEATRRLVATQGLEPATRAAMSMVLGGTYASLGLYAQAEGLMEQALAVRRIAFGEADARTLDARQSLALVRMHMGKFKEALPEAEAVYASAKGLPPGVRRRLNAPAAVGQVLASMARPEQAEGYLRESMVLQGIESGVAPGATGVAGVTGGAVEGAGAIDEASAVEEIVGAGEASQVPGVLALVLRRQNKLDEAEAIYTRELARVEAGASGATSASDGLYAATLANNLALIAHERGKLAEAEAMYRRSLETRERLYGPDHPETLMVAANLANLLDDAGRADDASRLHERVISTMRRTQGPDFAGLFPALNNYAFSLQNAKKYEQAEGLFQQIYDARVRLLGAENRDTLLSLNNLAMVKAIAGRDAEAEPLLERLLETRQRLLGEQQSDTIISRLNLGQIRATLKKPEDALATLRPALEAAKKVYAPGHMMQGVLRSATGRCLLDLKRYDEAEPMLVEAERVLRAGVGEGHRHTLKARRLLAELYRATGRPEEAQKIEPAPVAK
jgi:tetratricopeptide (TPR) repeat protein